MSVARRCCEQVDRSGPWAFFLLPVESPSVPPPAPSDVTLGPLSAGNKAARVC